MIAKKPTNRRAKSNKLKKNIATPSVNTNEPVGQEIRSEVRSLFCFMCAVLLTIALFSFDVQDDPFNTVSSGHKINNVLGIGGAYISSMLVETFGVAGWVLPILFFVLGYKNLLRKTRFSFVLFLTFVGALILASLFVAALGIQFAGKSPGGFVGGAIHQFMVTWLGSVGVVVVCCGLILIFFNVVFSFSIMRLGERVFAAVRHIQEAFATSSTMRSPKLDRTASLVVSPSPLQKEDAECSDAVPLDTKGGSSFFTRIQHVFAVTIPTYVSQLFNTKEPETEELFTALHHMTPYDIEDSARFSDITVTNTTTVQNRDTCNYIPEYQLQEEHTAIEHPINSIENNARIHTVIEGDKEDFSSTSMLTASSVKQKKHREHDVENESSAPVIEEHALPHIDLLGTAPQMKFSREEEEIMRTTGEKIIACLEEFKVKAELVRYTPGPVITQYEIRPLPGVRVNKVKNLGDDLALKLEAFSVRIQAPIPGTDLIGIEVPNKVRQSVYFQALVNTAIFNDASSPLTMALGKTTSGEPFVADLTQMPHLLIAGATGAGKSVCLNTIILSFLYKASPRDVQLLLIDPKRVELKTYQHLPHLVHPVITDMELARTALQWSVEEMERRYSMMERMGAKDILDYNARVRKIISGNKECSEVLSELPYLVIIIDELADLILTATKEVETNLTRLSQLARAAGIHLILATQRPSVDVVTALIKANFPSRIAFRVTSRHDSGTILDTVGAEKLLGKGDMLFKTTYLQRLHGAYVGTDEVEVVVEYWKDKESPRYTVDFAQWQEEKKQSSQSTGMFADESDPQYLEAIRFVCERKEASISAIQRRFRIGFNKAARYVEQMEQSGILENVGGSKRRVVRQQDTL